MKRKILLPIAVLVCSSLACSLFTTGLNRDDHPTPNEAVPAEPTPKATATPRSTPTELPTPAAVDEGGPVALSGEFTYTNSIITDYYVEQAVALVDMYGFVTRDDEWEIPVDGQVLGFLSLDSAAMQGDYSVQLPIQPRGEPVSVDPENPNAAGVQVFAVSYWPNLTGGPYSEGDDYSTGWPTYLASVITDTENDDEVTGGKLVVWAPDAEQRFPSAYGEDGLLFTADDPTAPLPAGWSVIDLDAQPFEIIRDEEPELALYEPQDVAVKDFSEDSYTEAFDKMFKLIQTEYAFNGIDGKQPDWEALYAEIAPQVKQAEEDQDPVAFFLALQAYTFAFKDGHVGLNGGSASDQVFDEQTGGGYGFAQRELEDGRVIVIYVTPGSPAEKAGLRPGDEVLKWNGEPVADAIAAVRPFSGPFSTDFALRYQQARYLLRAPLGVEASLTFQSADTGKEETIELEAYEEYDSFSYTSVYRGFDDNALPVEFTVLDSGVGYVRINSNYDDLNLLIRLFERALRTFENNQVAGVVIDMRQNSGGANLGLAGFLTEDEIELGQLAYYSEATGQFEPDGEPERVIPYQNQYSFDHIALMVDQACASACELEAYGFSQVPNVEVVGQYPSAGVEAEVARGQFLLPEGMSLQVPTGRFTAPDGSLFLEGTGVQPTVWVPIDEALALSQDDLVLQTALQVALGEDAPVQSFSDETPEAAAAATPTPSAGRPTPTPTPAGGGNPTPTAGALAAQPPLFASKDKATQALSNGEYFLEELAKESYSPEKLSQAGQTYSYTIQLEGSQDLLWSYGWCAADQETLQQNLDATSVAYTLDGKEIPAAQFTPFEISSGDQECKLFYALLTDWPAGSHQAVTEVTFSEAINDGAMDFPAGTHRYEYNVTVAP